MNSSFHNILFLDLLGFYTKYFKKRAFLESIKIYF